MAYRYRIIAVPVGNKYGRTIGGTDWRDCAERWAKSEAQFLNAEGERFTVIIKEQPQTFEEAMQKMEVAKQQ